MMGAVVRLLPPLTAALLLAQQSLAPYVPTPEDVVERMLALAEVARHDVVYDLGCGDGRIPIAAARKYGARGVGIDIDPRRVEEARANAKAAGVEHLVEFRLGDVMQADVSPATVVTLYLLTSSNVKLRPILQKQLRPGARIVSHAFSMGPDWPADRIEQFTSARGDEVTLYLWRVSALEERGVGTARVGARDSGLASGKLAVGKLEVGSWKLEVGPDCSHPPYLASARSTISSMSCV